MSHHLHDALSKTLFDFGLEHLAFIISGCVDHCADVIVIVLGESAVTSDCNKCAEAGCTSIKIGTITGQRAASRGQALNISQNIDLTIYGESCTRMVHLRGTLQSDVVRP